MSVENKLKNLYLKNNSRYQQTFLEVEKNIFRKIKQQNYVKNNYRI